MKHGNLQEIRSIRLDWLLNLVESVKGEWFNETMQKFSNAKWGNVRQAAEDAFSSLREQIIAGEIPEGAENPENISFVKMKEWFFKSIVSPMIATRGRLETIQNGKELYLADEESEGIFSLFDPNKENEEVLGFIDGLKSQLIDEPKLECSILKYIKGVLDRGEQVHIDAINWLVGLYHSQKRVNDDD